MTISDRPRRPRLTRTLPLVLLAVVTALVAIPEGTAGAAPGRTTATYVICPATAEPALPMTCTVIVIDTNGWGATAPGGTIAVTSSPSDDVLIGDCVLGSGFFWSACDVSIVFPTTGPHSIAATYTPTDGVHDPSASGADVVTVQPATTFRVYSMQSPVAGALGEQLDIFGVGCTDSGPGSTFAGVFVGRDDPLTTPDTWKAHETVATATGDFDWHPFINADVGFVFHARYYCADAPVTSIDDPAVMDMTGDIAYLIMP